MKSDVTPTPAMFNSFMHPETIAFLQLTIFAIYISLAFHNCNIRAIHSRGN